MVELDKGVAGDVRTARIMKEIANAVMPNVVQMEEDSPSAHSNAIFFL